jgi:hypothetical protein
MDVTIKIMPHELVKRIAAVGFATIFSIKQLLKMNQSYLIRIVTLHFTIFGIVLASMCLYFHALYSVGTQKYIVVTIVVVKRPKIMPATHPSHYCKIGNATTFWQSRFICFSY